MSSGKKVSPDPNLKLKDSVFWSSCKLSTFPSYGGFRKLTIPFEILLGDGFGVYSKVLECYWTTRKTYSVRRSGMSLVISRQHDIKMETGLISMPWPLDGEFCFWTIRVIHPFLYVAPSHQQSQEFHSDSSRWSTKWVIWDSRRLRLGPHSRTESKVCIHERVKFEQIWKRNWFRTKESYRCGGKD